MKILPTLILAALAAMLGACSPAEYRTSQGAAWGTVYHITYRSDRDLSDSIVAEMRRVELSVSAFEPASTVARINRGETLRADSMLAAVFTASKLVSRLSGGAFDPTVAPLVNLWGFGYASDRSSAEPPPAAAIDSALARVGIADCSLSSDLFLTKKHPATEFDFSAVAKGFGVDCVAAMLRRNGVADYLVEIGGEVAARGVNPRGAAWRIAVEAPTEAAGAEPVTAVALTDAALATSGNYRNYRRLSTDTVIGHTIDPRSGRPAFNTTMSATVEAPTCMLADALATACMVLPAPQALALCDSLPGIKILLVADSAGSWVIHSTF